MEEYRRLQLLASGSHCSRWMDAASVSGLGIEEPGPDRKTEEETVAGYRIEEAAAAHRIEERLPAHNIEEPAAAAH